MQVDFRCSCIAGENSSISPFCVVALWTMGEEKRRNLRNPRRRIYFVTLKVKFHAISCKFHGWLVRKGYDTRCVCLHFFELEEMCSSIYILRHSYNSSCLCPAFVSDDRHQTHHRRCGAKTVYILL